MVTLQHWQELSVEQLILMETSLVRVTLNTLVYECEFDDGTIKEYSANVIAFNIYEKGDADGFSSSMLQQIIDHKSTGEAVKMEDKYITTRTGTRRLIETTVGWSFPI